MEGEGEQQQGAQSGCDSNSFVIVPSESHQGSDSSFEELQGPETENVPSPNPRLTSEVDSTELENIEGREVQENVVDCRESEMDAGDANANAIDTCHDNVRQVLDDVEAQIERFREAVTKLSEDKMNLFDVLESIKHSLPGTDLTEVEREEINFEVSRLRGRAEDAVCEVVSRRTAGQEEARKVLDMEVAKLVKMVEQDPDSGDSERVCRSYLAACDGGDAEAGAGARVAVCHKFERLVLDCSVQDQKCVRLRLRDILQSILVLRQSQ